MKNYRLEGETDFYTDVTDLLSDGWPETQTVEVWDESFPDDLKLTTIAQLRAQAPTSFAKLHRVAARANEGYAVRTAEGVVHYAVALITEDEPGWVAFSWAQDIEVAKSMAKNVNDSHGISDDDALEIEISSMRAGRVR